jgi:hypothetical protein
MVIIIDEPKGGVYYGGAVAAPVFGETMGEALRILNITPDDMPSMKIAGVAAVGNHAMNRRAFRLPWAHCWRFCRGAGAVWQIGR